MSAKDKSWFEFRNVAGQAEIAIMDDIGAYGVSAKAFRAEMNRLGKTEPVRLHINSPGGSITEGNEIYNALKEHEGEVTITIGALCASIASVVAMAGDKVKMAKNGFLMIHNPWVVAGGDSEELRKAADIMDKMKSGIVNAYVSKTGLGEKEVSEMMDEETWLTAEEAKAKGFVDEIEIEIKTEEEDSSARNFDLSRFRNSAKFFSKPKSQNEGATLGKTGNGEAVNLTKLEASKLTTHKPKGTNQMSAIADPAEVQRLAKEEAAKMVAAKNARDKEINSIVAKLKERDKRDFSPLAAKFIEDGDKTLGEFYSAIANANTGDFKTIEQVGSGVELIEPLDEIKGTPGFAFVNSEAGRAIMDGWRNNGRQNFSATVKIPSFRNSTQTSSGLTSIQYQPGVVQLGVRPLRIKDLLAPGATNQTTIRYRQENAFQNDAAAVSETGALANLNVSYTEVDSPVKDIGGYIEMSENLMADYLAIASFINERVPYMIERTVEDQLLNGSGSGVNITGILSTSGVQTQAKSTDTAVDAIHKAITNVRFVPNAVQANTQGGYEPDAIVINPTDWQNIRLAKDANNQYFGGGPFTAAYGNGAFVAQEALWGKAVVVTPAIAAGTALVGAFRQAAQYFQRQGLTLELTNSNGTNFINRIVTLRGAERLALAVYLPNAFCKVTGL